VCGVPWCDVFVRSRTSVSIPRSGATVGSGGQPTLSYLCRGVGIGVGVGVRVCSPSRKRSSRMTLSLSTPNQVRVCVLRMLSWIARVSLESCLRESCDVRWWWR
jgi:hypothetical protein